MKKLTSIIAACLLLISTQSFTTIDEKVSESVKKTFTKSFAEAQRVKWEYSDGFYFAYFLQNGTEVEAAFTETGDLVGTARYLEMDKIPVKITDALKEKFPEHAFSALITEVNYDGEIFYLLTAQNSTKFMKLRCQESGEISVVSKIKKTV